MNLFVSIHSVRVCLTGSVRLRHAGPNCNEAYCSDSFSWVTKTVESDYLLARRYILNLKLRLRMIVIKTPFAWAVVDQGLILITIEVYRRETVLSILLFHH